MAENDATMAAIKNKKAMNRKNCTNEGDNKMESKSELKISPNNRSKRSDKNKFEKFNLKRELLLGIVEKDWKTPFPIQEAVIPIALSGRDIVAKVQFRRGKRSAYCIPILEKINPNKNFLQALILVPSSELALEAAETFFELGKHLNICGVVITDDTILKGDIPRFYEKGFNQFDSNYRNASRPQKSSKNSHFHSRGHEYSSYHMFLIVINEIIVITKHRKSHTHIHIHIQVLSHVIITTPNHMLELMEKDASIMSHCETLVLDEADHLLCSKFQDMIDVILMKLQKLPQILLFLGTVTARIKYFITKYLNEPHEIDMKEKLKTFMCRPFIQPAGEFECFCGYVCKTPGNMDRHKSTCPTYKIDLPIRFPKDDIESIDRQIKNFQNEILHTHNREEQIKIAERYVEFRNQIEMNIHFLDDKEFDNKVAIIMINKLFAPNSLNSQSICPLCGCMVDTQHYWVSHDCILNRGCFFCGAIIEGDVTHFYKHLKVMHSEDMLRKQGENIFSTLTRDALIVGTVGTKTRKGNDSNTINLETHCIVCYKPEVQYRTLTKYVNILLTCVDCGNRVHKYCTGCNFEPWAPLRNKFRCENCRICNVCSGSAKDNSNTCITCCETYHFHCHEPKISKAEEKDRTWKCSKCASIATITTNSPETSTALQLKTKLKEFFKTQTKPINETKKASYKFHRKRVETSSFAVSPCPVPVKATTKSINETSEAAYEFDRKRKDTSSFAVSPCPVPVKAQRTRILHSDDDDDFMPNLKGNITKTKKICLTTVNCKELDKLTNENKYLKEQIVKELKKTEQQREELDELTNENKSLKEQIKELQKTEQQREELDELTKENKSLKEQIKELQKTEQQRKTEKDYGITGTLLKAIRNTQAEAFIEITKNQSEINGKSFILSFDQKKIGDDLQVVLCIAVNMEDPADIHLVHFIICKMRQFRNISKQFFHDSINSARTFNIRCVVCDTAWCNVNCIRSLSTDYLRIKCGTQKNPVPIIISMQHLRGAKIFMNTRLYEIMLKEDKLSIAEMESNEELIFQFLKENKTCHLMKSQQCISIANLFQFAKDYAKERNEKFFNTNIIQQHSLEHCFQMCCGHHISPFANGISICENFVEKFYEYALQLKLFYNSSTKKVPASTPPKMSSATVIDPKKKIYPKKNPGMPIRKKFRYKYI